MKVAFHKGLLFSCGIHVIEKSFALMLTVALMALLYLYKGYPDVLNNVTQLGRMTLGAFQMVEDLLCAVGM